MTKASGVAGRRLGAATLLSAWLCAGCGTYNAEAAFASDFDCPGAVATAQDAPGRFVVHGCGRVATYVCMDQARGLCAIQTTGESGSSAAVDNDSYEPPAQATERIVSNVQVEKRRAGKPWMVLELALEPKALLRVTATPDKHADLVQFKLVRREPSQAADSCNIAWMVNGQVVVTPASVAVRKGEVLSQRVQMGRELIGELGSADKIALRACDDRWALNRLQVQKVRDFMDRFQEEMAWKTAPREAGSAAGGMLGPSGGWPAWTPPPSAPQAFVGAALDGSALFKKLPACRSSSSKPPAVKGMAQGSAVAVTTTELVTNCHVVQGAFKLVLKQNTQEWPASVVRADPDGDRCVITAAGATFQPVAGVRSYANIEVGEPVYTLGTPVGLELTLASGIISGRRDEDKHHYVQTTAPISPGSSGGGLFDARGNLLGVTTSVLVGREHMNQALNFAIPADLFFQP